MGGRKEILEAISNDTISIFRHFFDVIVIIIFLCKFKSAVGRLPYNFVIILASFVQISLFGRGNWHRTEYNNEMNEWMDSCEKIQKLLFCQIPSKTPSLSTKSTISSNTFPTTGGGGRIPASVVINHLVFNRVHFDPHRGGTYSRNGDTLYTARSKEQFLLKKYSNVSI